MKSHTLPHTFSISDAETFQETLINYLCDPVTYGMSTLTSSWTPKGSANG